MSWLSDFFRQDKFQLFIKLIIKAAKILFGQVAEDVYKLAEKHVNAAESSGKKGTEKLKLAYKGVKDELHGVNIPDYLINLAIEAAVVVLNERLVAHQR